MDLIWRNEIEYGSGLERSRPSKKEQEVSHTPHRLADEFPNDHGLLHQLKVSDPHFVNLAERYHFVNDEIHRIEAGIENTSDEHAETLKKKRLALVDEISGMLAKARAAA
jgi:uncharacterized protein YdcH (DUF465 family)